MSTASFDVSDVSDIPGAHHAREPAADRTRGPAPYRDEDFPGCESFHLPAGRLERYEGRLEFWDGSTETAWKVCEPTSIYHEKSSRRLGPTSGAGSGRRASAARRPGGGSRGRGGTVHRGGPPVHDSPVAPFHPSAIAIVIANARAIAPPTRRQCPCPRDRR